VRAHCDLHIHSCLSPCGDDLMTPNNIARMAYIKGLDVIALTDHNTAGNLPATEKVCRLLGVGFLPGMELTTQEEAHLLAYFPTVGHALSFSDEIYPFLPEIPNRPALFGKQTALDENDEPLYEEPKLLISALSLSLEEVIDRVHANGGLPVPAHINRGANGLLNVLGFLPPGLRVSALEVTRALPCPVDLSGYRVLFSSDAHTLEDILERGETIEVCEISAQAVFHHIKEGPNYGNHL